MALAFRKKNPSVLEQQSINSPERYYRLESGRLVTIDKIPSKGEYVLDYVDPLVEWSKGGPGGFDRHSISLWNEKGRIKQDNNKEIYYEFKFDNTIKHLSSDIIYNNILLMLNHNFFFEGEGTKYFQSNRREIK